MPLSPIQSTVLRAVVIAEPTLQTAINTGDDYAIANWCNDPAVPDFFVTKTTLSRHDILTATSGEGTTFAWAGAAYITRAQGERDAFREMFNSTGTVNPNLASIQAGFADIFSGAGGLPNRTHIAAISKRKATRAEKVLATVPGTGLLASPATLTYEGQVTANEASSLR